MLNLSTKLFPVLVSLLLVAPKAEAQKQITDFGVFTPEEIALKECEFDKDADAVVFLDHAISNYNDSYNLATQRRIRFKILKERGIERGNIRIRYYSEGDFETITGIDATVLNLDKQNNEVWSKLDRKSIYNKKLNKYYSEVSFALPNIKVGSIIEYRYESLMKHYGGLRDWTFQKDIPVALSYYNLTIIPNTEFAYTVYKSEEMPIVVKRDNSSGSVFFEMSNIPGLREEAYMGAPRDYLQRVKFQFAGSKQVYANGYSNTSSTTKYMTTWKELAKQLMDETYFGSQLNKTLPGIERLQQEWAKEQDPFTRMKKIHDYVKANFSWNRIYSKYADDGIKPVWEKRSGTNGEINLVLINLLKSSGLSVSPLLVSDRDFGKVDTTYPYIDQFDNVVAYVSIDGKSYILDGADRQTPFMMVPFKLLNTIGFVVDRKNPSLLKIQGDDKKSMNIVNVIGNIDNAGSVVMETSVNNYNYSKIEKKEKYVLDRRRYEKEFLEPFTATSIDTVTVEDIADDSLPMHHTVKLHYSLNKTADYYLVNYNLFTGLYINPFISEHRFTDINFGCKNSYILTATFNLPQALVVKSIPKSVRLVMSDQSMMAVRQIEQRENTIQVSLRIELSKTEFSAGDYPEVQGFYKQMLELINEPIVLKAKS